jgi:RHS repeat-associated protein
LYDERFASLQHRDTETGLDPTLYRMFSSNEGTWLSPDPLGGELGDPQSLNRYAYVRNWPTTGTDPLGLFAPGPCLINPFQPGCTDPIIDEFFLGGLLAGSGPIPANTDRGAGQGAARNLRAGQPFTRQKYNQCCQKAFGNTSGDVPGTMDILQAQGTLSFQASLDLVMASQQTGESVEIIAATFLIESGGGNLDPVNNVNQNGTVDIGPLQLNSAYIGKDKYHPRNAYGTNLGANEVFNGNAYLNILAGASYLASLSDPGNYVGSKASAVQHRDMLLDELTPKLQSFFDCLMKP